MEREMREGKGEELTWALMRFWSPVRNHVQLLKVPLGELPQRNKGMGEENLPHQECLYILNGSLKRGAENAWLNLAFFF